MYCLLCGLIIQASLVYFDQKGRNIPPLSSLSREGQNLWLSHNCQSCHQIHGLGGFLGPDLTNAIHRLTDARMEQILTEGSLQMPSYRMSPHEREALISFLRELDRTGKAWPTRSSSAMNDPGLRFQKSVASLSKTYPLSEAANKGRIIVQQTACLTCHLPNSTNVIQAPDLTQAVGKLTREQINDVLVHGRVEKGMPGFGMDGEQCGNIVEFLAWLHQHSDVFGELFRPTESVTLKQFFIEIPWFEYEI